jgi:hypothetical protein
MHAKKVDARDRFRVLLTEVLPYEVPLWFTNEYFHDECIAGWHLDPAEPLGQVLALVKKAALVPYSYWVIRDEGGIRQLSVMHPVAQLCTADFYAKYADLILHFCSRSTHSLRAPRQIAARFYESSSGDATSQGVEEEDNEKSYCSSYFQYSRYAFLYRFFESYDYHSLERRFRYMHQRDVSMCFDSIYTHSISWAVKSKVFAKKKLHTASFDHNFDILMSRINYGETNGIIVGPEVSRIFAEIILQEVDVLLVHALEKNGLALGKDYDFRRFVDDYFVFASKHSVCEEIERQLSLALAGFKMHLNKTKSEDLVRPFISPLTLCKLALSREIDRVFDGRWTTGSQRRLVRIQAPSRLANRTIVDIKSVVKRFPVMYKSISNYLLASYTRKVRSVIAQCDPERDGEDTIADMLLVDLDVVFFIYSMDIRVRPTDWVARFVQMVLGFANNLSEETRYLVKKKIFDMVRQTIDISIGVSEQVSFVEIQNMILVLSLLGSEFLLEESYLRRIMTKFLERETHPEMCSYFMWVTLMLYARDLGMYDVLRSELVSRMLQRFDEDDYCLDSAELFMQFVDFMTCPWIENGAKLALLRLAAKRHVGLPSREHKQSALVKRFEGKRFFVDWHDREWAAKRLEKKKYAYPYEQ